MFEAYEALHVIYASASMRVMRGARRQDGLGVIIKQATATDEAATLRVRFEHQLLVDLQTESVPNIPTVVDFIASASNPALVLADVGGESLRAVASRDKLSLHEVLYIAAEVCRALAVLHSLDVLHKDINPANLIYNRSAKRVQLIDFGHAARVAREPQAHRDAIDGTLDYLAPEQTGRVNRPIDWRADFYALGATLFELCTGRPPFVAERAADLLRDIITALPPSMDAVTPGIPETLGALVAKLLAKQPEARYQSAAGLEHDLRRCLEELEQQGNVSSFELAQADRAERFDLPNRLYGREADVAAVQAACRGLRKPGLHCVWVSGPSGIGKSALAKEAELAGVEMGALFAAGKCDPLRAQTPYHLFEQVLSQLLHGILLQPDNVVRTWSRRLQEAAGTAGGKMMQLMPSLRLILGSQPPAPELPAKQAESWLRHGLSRLMASLHAEAPLVLFLDDLQWVDSSSLSLLASLGSEPATTGFGCVVLAAFRDREAAATSLPQVIDSLKAKGAAKHDDICLGPLRRQDIADMLREGLSASAESVQDLAALVHEKTAGNAFFVHQFLEHLAHRRFIQYDAAQSRWTWKYDKIVDADVTSNVVELLLERMQVLPQPTREIMGQAAVLGSVFDLSALMTMAGRDANSLVQNLDPALRERLLIPLSANYRFAGVGAADARYKFAHDKVHQAAYESLAEAERLKAHRALGTQSTAQWHEDAADDVGLLSAIGHLNRARSLGLSADERARLLALNRWAARVAQRASAYDSALQFTDVAVELLGDNGWQDFAETLHALLLERADSLFGLDRSDQALAQLSQAWEHVGNAQQRVDILRRRADIHYGCGDYQEALKSGIAGLQESGYPFPSRPNVLSLIRMFLRLQLRVRGRTPESLIHAPRVADPKVLSALNFLNALTMPAHMAGEQLTFALAALHIAYLSAQHGNSRYTALGYVALAVAMCKQMRLRDGAKWAEIALGCLDAVPHSSLAGFVQLAARAEIRYAVMTASGLVDQSEHEFIHCPAESLPIAGGFMACLHAAAMTRLSIGRTETLANKYAPFLAGKSADVRGVLQVHKQFARSLRGLTHGPTKLSEESFSEESLATDRGAVGATYYAYRCMLNYFNEDDAAAINDAREAMARDAAQACPGQIFYTMLLYAALAIVRRTRTAGQRLGSRPLMERRLVGRARSALKALHGLTDTRWAGPYELLDAELLSLKSDKGEAYAAYDRAMTVIEQEQCPQFTATGCEAVLRYCFATGLKRAAQNYFERTLSQYEAWGATTKVTGLTRAFADLHAAMLSQHGTTQTRRTSSRASSQIDSAHGLTLDAVATDLLQLATASHPRAAVAALQESLRQNCEATQAIFLTRQGEAFLPLIRTDPPPTFCVAAAAYAARTQKPVLIDDSHAQEPWSTDAYLAQGAPMTLLVVPLLRQRRTEAVLYLENNVTVHAFHTKQLAAAQILGSATQWLLDNERLENNVEAVLDERKRQLQAEHAKALVSACGAVEVRMAGGFAHEVGNALGTANYMLEALFDDSPDALLLRLRSCLAALSSDPGAEQVQACEEVVQNVRDFGAAALLSVRRTLTIVERILAYARVGETMPSAERISLRTAVDLVLDKHTRGSEQAPLRVRQAIPEGLQLRMKAEHVEVILGALVGNALDALKENSSQEAEVRIKASSHQGRICVRVEDDGVGIAEENQGRIAQAFFTTKGARGMGLSLSMSQKLLQVYGGTLRFESHPGKGSVFEFEVPEV